MKLRNKKGFTIVELVIVIGVIGILSAILIPTFINVTENAKKSAMKSNCANAYSAYVAEAADGVIDGTDPEVAIEHKKQEEVQLTKGTETFIFDGEWKKGALTVGADQELKYVSDTVAHSTYNEYIVQYVGAAA